MTLQYSAGDERPYWQATVTVNGTTDDMSTGYTFNVNVYSDVTDPVLTKTTNITGAAAGVVTVTWTADELDIAAGNYTAELTAKRTSDDAEWTIREPLRIIARA